MPSQTRNVINTQSPFNLANMLEVFFDVSKTHAFINERLYRVISLRINVCNLGSCLKAIFKALKDHEATTTTIARVPITIPIVPIYGDKPMPIDTPMTIMKNSFSGLIFCIANPNRSL